VDDVALIVSMTHPLFAGTPVDDLPPELQWIIASYIRHPAAALAWEMSILFFTRTYRNWWEDSRAWVIVLTDRTESAI
jgi:hypothetical protein